MATPEGQDRIRRFVKKFAKYYKACAVILLNTFVLFVILNLLLAVVFKVRDGYDARNEVPQTAREMYGMALMERAYPGYQRDELNALLDEGEQVRHEYEPFTQYKEKTRSGKWYNVDANGFRRVKDQGPWPPQPGNVNVFLFGGSTGFGYGVGDEQTVASHLQEFLGSRSGKEVRVYNFGRGSYYSSQERILFEKLLLAGHVPTAALFLDGYNDFYYARDRPEYTRWLAAVMDGVHPLGRSEAYLSQQPVMRAVKAAKRRLGVAGQDQAVVASRDFKPYPEDETGDAKVIDRYTRNKRMTEVLARAYGVTAVFVWQPIPWYKYDLKYHLFTYKGAESHPLAREYRLMAKAVKERPHDFSDNFLWLADVQEESQECHYIDAMHYNNKFSNEIAAHIGHLLLEQKLLNGGTR